MRSRTASTLLVIACLSLPHPGHGLGIAMRFVDVTIENVEPGAHFNLRLIRNLPLIVINQEDSPTDILIEAVLPRVEEMKEGYEPIPDPNWIKVLPDRFHLGPKASASSDVIIQIPDDPKLIGRHYEAIIWVHTDARKQAREGVGMAIQAGLRSRFRMSIGTMGPASLQREKALKRLATINTNFNISPDNLFVQQAPLGVPVDLKALKKASLKIINESDDPVKLKIASVKPDENILPQSGYNYAPDPSWLIVNPDVVNVEGNSIKEIKLTLKIPDQPDYRNKKYMFLIRTTLAGESLPLAYNNMVYITTSP